MSRSTDSVGVADENHGPVLRSEDELRSRNVVGQRESRVLDDADGVAVLLQNSVNALPSCAIHEATVDENDVHELLRHDDPLSIRNPTTSLLGYCA